MDKSMKDDELIFKPYTQGNSTEKTIISQRKKYDQPLITKGMVDQIYDAIDYERILWIGGFVKTTLSASFIGTGTTLLLSGICNYPFFLENPFLNSIIGLAGIIVGIVIVILIDLDRKRYKKKEIEYYATELQKLSVDIASQMIKHDIEELHEEINNLQTKGVKEEKE